MTAATAFSIGRASSTESSAAMISESDVPRKLMPFSVSSL